jgi:hypothetical protein
MIRTRKNKLKRHSEEPSTGRRHTLGTEISASSQVEEVPPTDNLRKHPDEAYGDTEVPHRGPSAG